MQPRPDNAELAVAVREFLESEIMPVVADARLKFRLLVAMNALSMLGRAPLEEGLLQLEAEHLAVLLGVAVPNWDSRASLDAVVLDLNSQLASQIRLGIVPVGTLTVLSEVAVAKLQVASPAYLKRY